MPNAFSYFIEIERMLAADTDIVTGLLVNAVYAVIYCMPCLVLLSMGLVSRERTRSWLQTVTRRVTEGVVRRPVLAAALIVVTGVAVARIPFVLMAVA